MFPYKSKDDWRDQNRQSFHCEIRENFERALRKTYSLVCMPIIYGTLWCIITDFHENSAKMMLGKTV